MCWEGASLWVLQAPPGINYPRTAPHAHHAVQVTLALTGRVNFTGAAQHVEGVAIAIAPDSPHAFEGTGLVAHLFVASDGEAGRRLLRRLLSTGTIVPIPADHLGDLPAQLRTTFEDPRRTDADLRAVGRALVTQLAGDVAEAEPADPRIETLIAWASGRLDETVTLGDAAARLGLSPGRTRHLFVERTGLSFRTFLLWLRLMRAVELFAGGTSLTEAAYAAGFSDSAHLSRTFRRMFGIVPASLRVT